MWMLVSSFKPEREVRAVPPTWWPETITLENYDRLFTQLDFPTYFMNSVIVALAVTIGNMIFCSMLGYALAKLDFPGKKALFIVVLGTLMVPGVVTFVPLFVITTKMGLTNTLIGHDPAVPGRTVRGVPDAAVHPDPARRAHPGRAHRRCGGDADLRLGDPAAVRARAGDARDPDVPRLVEQLPVAARGGPDRGQVHAARRSGALRRRPERHPVRTAAGGLRRRGRPRARCCSCSCSATSCKASP